MNINPQTAAIATALLGLVVMFLKRVRKIVVKLSKLTITIDFTGRN